MVRAKKRMEMRVADRYDFELAVKSILSDVAAGKIKLDDAYEKIWEAAKEYAEEYAEWRVDQAIDDERDAEDYD